MNKHITYKGAALALALAFTLSCSNDIEKLPEYAGSSSSAKLPEGYVYCLVGNVCEPVSETNCSILQGKEVPSCEASVVSSSSGGVSSSRGDDVSSSSSDTQSSSYQSSSSIAISSSSSSGAGGGVSSSSSETQSSSSATLSSSSAVVGVGLCEGFVKGTKREHYGMDKEQFCDERDGKEYVYVEIGGKTWMAENLNYNATNSKCYGEGNSSYSASEVQANCDTYGRLYDWSTAMALPSSCNSSTCSGQVSTKHQGICPDGWHIPSNADWDALMKFVNPSCSDNATCAGAGTKLKAASGWNPYSGIPVGDDTYDFSALPGGNGTSGGDFLNVGGIGDWLSASEYNSNNAYSRVMYYFNEDVYYSYSGKIHLESVRCLQD
jgi:uncharacterized protein (TIGR02145 family)